MQKSKVIVICGPTASGKTTLSIQLAKAVNGEIISADSMQIYKDMNIGTAKPDEKEMDGIKHYLLDVVSPEERYSVANYVKDARDAIKEVLGKEKTPIIVGGTGLYINSLVYEIQYDDIEFDQNYRDELEKIIQDKGLEYLYEEAAKIDPEAIKNISPNDRKRIMRILEIFQKTGMTKTEQEILSRKKELEFDYKIYGITMDRKILYDRINKRVDIMMDQGLIKEVDDILKKYKGFPTAMQGLGYKEVVEYLKRNCSKEEMVEKLKMMTRRYAKRQMTWFNKTNGMKWLDRNK